MSGTWKAIISCLVFFLVAITWTGWFLFPVIKYKCEVFDLNGSTRRSADFFGFQFESSIEDQDTAKKIDEVRLSMLADSKSTGMTRGGNWISYFSIHITPSQWKNAHKREGEISNETAYAYWSIYTNVGRLKNPLDIQSYIRRVDNANADQRVLEEISRDAYKSLKNERDTTKTGQTEK